MLGRIAVAFLLASSLAATARADYPNPPKILTDTVARVSETVAEEESGDQLLGFIPELVSLVVADLLAREYGLDEIAAYQYFGEVGRSDKQTGSTSGSNGTTTVVERAGFPTVLSLAVERGAIQQEKNGTTTTLSTTPYATLVAFKDDTAERHRQVGWLDRLGLSTTFEAESGGSDFEELAQFSARARILGDRSTRSLDLHKKWAKEVQPSIASRLKALTGLSDTVFNSPDGRALLEEAEGVLEGVAARLDEEGENVTEASAAQSILEGLGRVRERMLSEPGSEGHIPIPEDAAQGVRRQVKRLVEAHDALRKAKRKLEELLEDHSRSQILSAATTLNRIDDGSDFWEMKLLYETPQIESLDLAFTANAALSLNSHRDSAVGDDERIRDYSFAVGIERRFDNFLTGELLNAGDSPVVTTLNGKVSRLENADRTIGVGQLKIEVPIAVGISVPISFSYASGTETSGDDDFTFAVAGIVDTDKLLALARQFTGF